MHEWWWDLLKPNMNVLDIGANIGQYTIDLARAVAPGIVYAFEPAPKVAAVLREALDGVDNVIVMPIALGNTKQLKRVFHYRDWTLLGVDQQDPRYKDKQWIHPSQRNDLKGEFVTQFTTLDSLMGQYFHDVPIGFIKIDVDGYEYRVLQGGLAWLEKMKPPLRVEIGYAGLKELGNTPELVLDLLRYLGYVFYADVLREPLSVEAILSVRLDETIDVLCLPQPSLS